MGRSKADTKKKSLLKYNINKHNMVLFCKKWKKYNEIQLTKNKWPSTIEKLSTLPRYTSRSKCGHERKKSQQPSYSSDLPSPRVATPQSSG